MAKKFIRMTTEGIRHNLVPGVILWVVALLLVLGYYFLSPVRRVFEEVALLKSHYGYLFSGLSTILFAGVIPFFYLWLAGKTPRKHLVGDLLFYIFFWGWKGLEVDFLYRLQGVFFGNVPDFWTIFRKVLVDQFVYNPLWAAPTMAILYLWREQRFSFTATKELLKRELFPLRIPSLLISTWLVWIPSVSIIYCFPPALQIPMFNLVVCFWALFLNIFSSIQDRHNAGEPAPR